MKKIIAAALLFAHTNVYASLVSVTFAGTISDVSDTTFNLFDEGVGDSFSITIIYEVASIDSLEGDPLQGQYDSAITDISYSVSSLPVIPFSPLRISVADNLLGGDGITRDYVGILGLTDAVNTTVGSDTFQWHRFSLDFFDTALVTLSDDTLISGEKWQQFDSALFSFAYTNRNDLGGLPTPLPISVSGQINTVAYSVVPIPATAWLFLSAIGGLLGAARIGTMSKRTKQGNN